MKNEMNVAVQTYNRENHEKCLSCGEEINHPICPNCLSKGFNEWIIGYPRLHKETSNKLSHFLNKTSHLKGKTCIKCGYRKIHTCPYCFTEYLYKLIKEAGAGITTLSEFLFLFNFDFERKGYSRELEAFGGY
jgi:hypothetical protein